MTTPCFVANWKMNKTVAESMAYLDILEATHLPSQDAEIILAPPYTALSSVAEKVKRGLSSIGISGQNMYYEERGAYTGEIAPAMLREFCQYVIIGHSERRHIFGETGSQVQKKVQAAWTAGMVPILCVGETKAERDEGLTWAVVQRQLAEALQGLRALRGPGDLTGREADTSSSIPTFLVAYEPVWAIGTGVTPSEAEVEEMHAKMAEELATRDPNGPPPRLLYGGSVNEKNIASLMRERHVDGVLVGGTSLSAEGFLRMIQIGIVAHKEKSCTR